MSQIKRIFIVGHSGAGKGVLAKGVAEKLGWKFIDADFALAPTIGRDVIEIIGHQSEQNFLNCLTEILLNQINQEEIVVTTDDSIICNEKNRQLLTSEFTINLKVSTPVQVTRISHNRPLLAVSDYEAFLDKFHPERDALYEEVASLTLNSDENNLEGHVLSVINAIKLGCVASK